jgi:catenin alpha
MENHEPLYALINTAKAGDKQNLNDRIDTFSAYGNNLAELSLLACSLSTNVEGGQMVEAIARRLRSHMPHIIKTSKILCSLHTSQEAWGSMVIVRDLWINEVKLLTLAMDEIMSIDDFLLVCENAILSDINKSVELMQSRKAIDFAQTADQITKRVTRVCEMVSAEINNYEACEFTKNLANSVRILKQRLDSGFVKCVDHLSEVMAVNSSTKSKDDNLNLENEVVEESRLVYYAVRDLRHAMIQVPQQHQLSQLGSLVEEEVELLSADQIENENNNQNEANSSSSSTIVQNADEEEPESDSTLIPTGASSPNATKQQQEEIQQQFDSFKNEKKIFDREVLKWDDKSNEIVVLSKAMCVILMDMTSFTRSRGPYTTIADVIGAAKKISEIGSKLEKLCRELANDCPESQSKRELLGYLKSLGFFCSQMNICVKVKENIIDVSLVKLFSCFLEKS